MDVLQILEKHNEMISDGIIPIRITLFVSLFWGLLNGDRLSDPSLMFYYWFPAIYASSFAIELVLTSRKGLVEGAKSLSMKYFQMLPVEFVGIAGFALLTFAPHTLGMWLSFELLLVVISCTIGIWAYHRFVVPRLSRIKSTPRIDMLATVGLTIAVFFMGLYFLVLSSHHLVFFNN